MSTRPAFVRQLTTKQISWRRMLEAIPRRNEAGVIEPQEDGSLRIILPLQPTWWMRPPVSWILHPRATRAVRLDHFGVELWELCDGMHTVEEIIEEFAAAYDLTFHEARVSVTGHLKIMIQRGVLAIEQLLL